MNKKRDTAIDLIRLTAFLTVVATHFFLHSGYYTEPVLHRRMLLMTVMRSGALVCVPLFLMITGYLMKNKLPEGSYYRRIWRPLTTYLAATLVCVGYKVFIRRISIEPINVLLGLLDYSHAYYGWYMEMYFGLFLMIPFLNLAFNGLKTKKGKLALVFTCVFLTALPPVLNVYNLVLPGWWGSPGAVQYDYSMIIPGWWRYGYPITYYYIGCYLREYPLKLRRSANLLLLFASVAASGLYNYWRSHGFIFAHGDWSGYGSLLTLIPAVLLFAFFMSLDYSGLSDGLRALLARLSGLCLGAYLLSWIFDDTFYPILAEKVPEMTLRLEYFPLTVAAVYICSLALSFVMELVMKLLGRLLPRGKSKE